MGFPMSLSETSWLRSPEISAIEEHIFLFIWPVVTLGIRDTALQPEAGWIDRFHIENKDSVVFSAYVIDAKKGGTFIETFTGSTSLGRRSVEWLGPLHSPLA
jgi:hypothetical protein